MKRNDTLSRSLLPAFMTAITVMASSPLTQAVGTETPSQSALPDFMTPAQLTKWRAETTAKTATRKKAEAAAENLTGTESDKPTGFYTGKPYLPESGTYAYKYRQYSPVMARWTTVDPSGFPDGANNRIYVNNKTVSHYDPDGKQTAGGAGLQRDNPEAYTQVFYDGDSNAQAKAQESGNATLSAASNTVVTAVEAVIAPPGDDYLATVIKNGLKKLVKAALE